MACVCVFRKQSDEGCCYRDAQAINLDDTVPTVVCQPTTLEWGSAGVPCKDVSLANLNRSGAAGRTHVAAITFLECERAKDPDVTYIECTPAGDARILKEARPQHPCYRIGLRGRDVGDQ